jgi:hypothetical protein
MVVRYAAGAVLRVPLAGDRFAYAVMLAVLPYVAFYSMDARLGEQHPPDGEPLVVGLERKAYSGGRWGKVVFRLRPQDIPPAPRFFRQNVMRPDDCEIIDPNTGESRAALPRECVGLERAAVWAAEHVESCLEDHYAGRPNDFVESLRLKT